MCVCVCMYARGCVDPGKRTAHSTSTEAGEAGIDSRADEDVFCWRLGLGELVRNKVGVCARDRVSLGERREDSTSHRGKRKSYGEEVVEFERRRSGGMVACFVRLSV